MLSKSLQEIQPDSENLVEWISLHWPLAVGEKVASVSRVERVSAKTLFVQLDGGEWLPAVKSLEKKILDKINAGLGAGRFSRMVFNVVERFEEKPGIPKITNGSGKQVRTPNNSAPLEESVDMIKDDELRATLKRLGSKFRFAALAIVVGMLFAGCSNLPVRDESKPASLSGSFAVKQIKLFHKKGSSLDAKDPRAYFHYLKALEAERKYDFDAAVKHYGKVVAHDPTSRIFYKKLVLFLQRTAKFVRAVKVGEEALERFPDDVQIRKVVADCLARLGKHESALKHYFKIIELDEPNARARLLAGHTLVALGRSDEAFEWFEKSVLADSANPLGYHYLGKEHYQRKNFREAEENFKKAIDRRPSFLQARNQLARTLEVQEKYEEAIAQYKIILKLTPGNKKVVEHLKKLTSAIEFSAEGSASLKESIELLTLKGSDPHLVMGSIYYEQASYMQAIDEFRLVQHKKEYIDLHVIMAKIYELLGRIDKAVQEYQAYNKKKANPDSVDILVNLARLHGLEGDMEKAIGLIKKAIGLKPDSDRLFHSLALAYMSLNKNEEAIENVQKAIKLNDTKDAYYFELGALQERVGKHDRAIESMKQALEINPNHSNAHNFIGYIYAMRGEKLDLALEHLEKALVIQPRNGYFLDSLGWVYFKRGEPKKALAEIRRAMVYTAPDPVLYDHLGDVLFSLKNFIEAKRAWQTSLSLTLKKMKKGVGEIPDPVALEEKMQKTDKIMQGGH